MLNTGSLRRIGYIFPLTDLAVETNTRQPEILHAKDPICILERGVELCAIIHVAWNDLSAEGFQLLCGRLVKITRQGAHLPAICQKFSCNGSALLTGRAGDCNDFVVHFI